jgi:membrane protease subunit HflK
MAWNEPGGNKEHDPWSGKNNQQTPPELEQLLKKLQANMRKLFGFKPSVRGTVSKGSAKGVGLVIGLAFALWAGFGVFIVNPAERAIVLRLGKFQAVLDSGLHWIPRFIDQYYIVNEQKIDHYDYQAQMLTKDENIVSVAVAVQYRIQNARDFLFNVDNPTQSLRQATASALRQVVGQTSLDDILTRGRDQARQDVMQRLSKILAAYKTGILITAVAMQPARAPDAVKEAFDDAIKAQEDEQRFVNEAQAYVMRVVPAAKGAQQRIAQDAAAYKEQIVLKAQGDSTRFLALLAEYAKAPEVTRQRLYLDSMENILHKTSKILLDSKANQAIYLPLDKFMPAEYSRKPSKLVDEGIELNQPEPSSSGPGKEQLGQYGYSRDSYLVRRGLNENK